MKSCTLLERELERDTVNRGAPSTSGLTTHNTCIFDKKTHSKSKETYGEVDSYILLYLISIKPNNTYKFVGNYTMMKIIYSILFILASLLLVLGSSVRCVEQQQQSETRRSLRSINIIPTNQKQYLRKLDILIDNVVEDVFSNIEDIDEIFDQNDINDEEED